MSTTKLLTTSGAAVLFALMVTAGPAAAIAVPEPGSGTPSVAEPGPPNYPEYDPQYEVPPVTVAQDTGLDASSAALGALAGIALAGAGLGTAMVVTRRRDNTQSA
ncbi:hypothetical protein [Kribbella pittospori]|uniref:hypothetical protein n=1 Tax=Kribbella pittospori TaxID=722689 RepID=UPI0013F4BC0C|nr:hypothetical protein [Kribbella pittospori]